jgi:hypothetical protein
LMGELFRMMLILKLLVHPSICCIDGWTIVFIYTIFKIRVE